MKIVVTQEFDNETVKDLLTCAMEGGSNYWYIITEEIIADGLTRKDFEFPHNDIPFKEGCGLMIGDAEEEEAESILLNLASMEKGLQVMSEKYPIHFANFTSENFDAETGDVFLQCCLFGELVFG